MLESRSASASHRDRGIGPTPSAPSRSKRQNASGPSAPGNRQPIPTIAIGSLGTGWWVAGGEWRVAGADPVVGLHSPAPRPPPPAPPGPPPPPGGPPRETGSAPILGETQTRGRVGLRARPPPGSVSHRP